MPQKQKINLAKVLASLRHTITEVRVSITPREAHGSLTLNTPNVQCAVSDYNPAPLLV